MHGSLHSPPLPYQILDLFVNYQNLPINGALTKFNPNPCQSFTPLTVYRETLTKGKFDEFGSNHQIKHKAIAICASVLYFNLLYEHCIE